MSRQPVLCAFALLLAASLLCPQAATAGRLSAESFYAQSAPTIATLEFVQEFVASGQRQQTRSFSDAVVISADGLVLISGRVRFPQRGSRLSGGSLPELGSLILHFADGRKHRARIVAFDDDLNLGLLRISDARPEQVFPHAKMRAEKRVRVGQTLRVMTLYTQEYGRTPVYAQTRIGALLRTPQEVWSLAGVSANLLGAPLWNDRGLMVGVIAQVPMSPSGGRQVVPTLSGPVGLSYARFKKFIDEAVASQAASAATSQPAAGQSASAAAPDEAGAAWMGVMFQPLSRELSKHLGISPGGGVVLSRVIPGSPAAAAGLQPLDILVELDGERIAVQVESDTALFARQIRSYQPGTVHRFTREKPGGERSELPLTLAESPLSELHAQRLPDEYFELTVRELTLDTRLAHRMNPDATGVVVDGVTRAGWGGLAGLRRGQIIQRINQHEVTDIAGFAAAMEAIKKSRPDKVLFFTRFSRSTKFLVAEPDWDELEPSP
jgi:serine protease Do